MLDTIIQEISSLEIARLALPLCVLLWMLRINLMEYDFVLY